MSMRTALSAVVAAVIAAVAFADVEVVRDGRPKMCVVLPADAPEYQKYAAAEFARWTETVTGAKIPVGESAAEGLTPLRFEILPRDEKDVRWDGFKVTAGPDGVVLAAKETDAILFGVYYLLSRFAGIQWYHPESGADFRPKRDFSIPSKLLKIPMRARQGVGSGNGRLATRERRNMVAEWNMRVGFKLGQVYPETKTAHQTAANYYYDDELVKLGMPKIGRGGGHILGELVLATPVDEAELEKEIAAVNANELGKFKKPTKGAVREYAKWKVLVRRHPDWFGLVGGERVPTGCTLRSGGAYDGGPTSMPCLSNPEVREAMLANFRRWKKEKYDGFKVTYNLCCDDQGQWCECDRCAKLMEKRGGKGGNGAVSDYWWDFINWMSERMLEDPDVELGVYLYRGYRDFPKTVKPIARDRMHVIYCTHGRCYLHALTDPACPANPPFVKVLEKWASVGMPVNTFEYMSQMPGKCNYAFWEKAWIEDLGFFREHGIAHGNGGLTGVWDAFSSDDSYFRQNCAKARWQVAWLTSHFEWDPDDDPEAVREAMYADYYEKAWPAMKKYHALLEKAMLDTKLCMCYGSPNTIFTTAAFTPGLIEEAKKLLAEAEKAAAGDETTLSRLAWDRTYFASNWESCAQPLDFSKVNRIPRAGGKPLVFDDFRLIFGMHDMTDRAPNKYRPQTSASFLYDDDFLYLKLACAKTDGRTKDVEPDPSDPFHGAMNGSHVEVLISSPDLNGKYYHLAVSHRGDFYSALTQGAQTRDFAKTLDVKPVVRDFPDRWTCVLKIPLAPFGSHKDGDIWKIDVIRAAVGAGGRIQGYGSVSGYPFHAMEYVLPFSFGAPGNLLENGSFEAADPISKTNRHNGCNWTFKSETIPAKWTFQANGGTATLEKDDAADGARHLRIVPAGKGGPSFLLKGIGAYPKTAKKLSYSFRARGKGAVEWIFRSGPKTLGTGPKHEISSADWQVFKGEFPATDEARPSGLMLRFTGDEIDLDDCILTFGR